MKTLLINAPDQNSKYKKFLGLTAPPLGIAYIASYLEKHEKPVNILDAAVLGWNWKKFRQEIKKEEPNVIGITTTTSTIFNDLKAAQICKQEYPDSKIILGGYHASFCDREVLEGYPFVDAVVRGEGENTALELANGNGFSKIKGLTWRRGKTIVRNPAREVIMDLDTIPFPARHLLPMDKYKILGGRYPPITMIASRGCPMACAFCASSALHGTKVRFRSPENVFAEMKHVRETYNTDTIAFMDDTFTLFPFWIKKLCSLIKKHKLKATWGCTARVDKMSKRLMKMMKDVGCYLYFVGVESATEEILKRINKGFTSDKVVRFFEWTRDLNMRTIASLAFGFPGETKKTIERTVEFVKKLDPTYAVFALATPYPGTRFYKEMIKEKLIKTKDWAKYDLMQPIIETLDLSLEELRKAQIEAFKKFYLRPTYILKSIWRERGDILSIIRQVLSSAIVAKFNPNSE